MESDDDVKGDGLNYTTEYRQYDPRVGRWFSPDPVVKPWESPYAGFANNPVYYNDPSGLDPTTGGPPPANGKAGDTHENIQPDGKINHWDYIEGAGWILDTENKKSYSGYSWSPSGPTTVENPTSAAGTYADVKQGDIVAEGNRVTIRNASNEIKLKGDQGEYGMVLGTMRYYESEVVDKYCDSPQAGSTIGGPLKFIVFAAMPVGEGIGVLSEAMGVGTKNGIEVLAGYGSDATVTNASYSLVPKPGWVDIVIHGTEDGLGFTLDGQYMAVEELYATMLADGYQQGSAIRLVSCFSGSVEGGAAQELANLTGAVIEAPTQATSVIFGQPVVHDGGTYLIFTPK